MGYKQRTVIDASVSDPETLTPVTLRTHNERGHTYVYY